MAGAISSGIGLVSGLPVDEIINSLISLEARPLTLLQTRIEGVQLQRAAYAELTARLLGLKGTVSRFDEPAFFRAFQATSSNESVLTATAGENAAIGNFQFQVKSLVTNHQLISRGYANSDEQPVGAGRLTFELGHGRLDTETDLDVLNGGAGVRRGKIEIADSTGARATVDLSTAITVQDVLDEINARTDIGVLARVEGDHIVLEDQRDGSQVLSVLDVGGGHSAEDLGIAAVGDADGVLAGSRVLYLSDASRLSSLNDGNGVAAGKLGDDIEITTNGATFTVALRGILTRHHHFDQLNSGNGVREGTIRITNRAGESAEIVVDESVKTIGDLQDAIAAAGIDVSVTFGATEGQLLLTDNSTPPDGATAGRFVIEDVNGNAAADLGIVADTDTDTTSVTGSVIHRIDTLGDVLRAINYAVDATDPNQVIRNEDIVAQVGASGRGIELVSQSGIEFSVAPGEEGSDAARQLGLIGESEAGRFVARDVLSGMNSVLLSSLRGGQGIRLGEVKFTDASGAQTVIDFSAHQPGSVQELMGLINRETDAAGVGIVARLNDVGTGLLFEDTSGGSGAMRLKDVGSAGRTIGDLFDVETGDVQSSNGMLNTGNTQLQYISRATALAGLNGGGGVATGSFTITASDGGSVTVNVTENQATIGGVIDVINATGGGIGIAARINANGDGIEIVDTSGGTGTLSIDDSSGGRTAADLNIAGEGASFTDGEESGQRIDGSFEFHVDVDADDTLADLRQKINELDLDVRATIVNDGSATDPFHLVFSSAVTGTRGRVVVDTGSTGLSFDTLVEARDAVVFFGGSGSENPIVLTSSTNTLTGVLEDVTINLTGTSDDPVDLSIVQDVDRIVGDLENFVSGYNGVLEAIEEHTSFNPETNARGPLFSDGTVNLVQNRLRTVVNSRVAGGTAGFDRLLLVGIRAGSGGRLSFDEEKFREAYTDDPEAIEALFATEDVGMGDRLDTTLDELTRSIDGVLTRRDEALQDREELFNDRIAAIEEKLTRKRERLQRQFQGLETALSNLQAAQSAIGQIAGLAAGVTG